MFTLLVLVKLAGELTFSTCICVLKLELPAGPAGSFRSNLGRTDERTYIPHDNNIQIRWNAVKL